jgi:uncharacterized surface protein with fasciclin (FAS1) repeats
MKKLIVVLLATVASNFAFGQNKDVADLAINTANHTTLEAAIKAADLVATLKGPGPFTVFAPTNAAFDKLPAGTVETLLKAENKEKLTGILTYHVVNGVIDANAIIAAVNDGKGKAEIITLNGGKLTVTLDGGKVKLTDENGNVATVITADLKGSNGVVHVIDTVVLPK